MSIFRLAFGLIPSFLLVCYRNSSRAIGMCPHGQWKKVSKGLPWVGMMSPFDSKILDIRAFGGSSKVITLELSAKQGRVLVLFCVLQF